jgi:hypothetical protein
VGIFPDPSLSEAPFSVSLLLLWPADPSDSFRSDWAFSRPGGALEGCGVEAMTYGTRMVDCGGTAGMIGIVNSL